MHKIRLDIFVNKKTICFDPVNNHDSTIFESVTLYAAITVHSDSDATVMTCHIMFGSQYAYFKATFPSTFYGGHLKEALIGNCDLQLCYLSI